MSYWTVPRVFEGQTVAVLASGPSMSRADADRIHAAGIPTVAINRTFELAPWAWMLYGADPDWWARTPGAMAFAGLKVSCSEVPGVFQLQKSGMTGFDPDQTKIRLGGNSGYQAVHIAAQTGAARILLLGFDMRPVGHWHPEHPPPLAKTHADTYPTWVSRFETLAVELKKRGVEVVNCTPDSALRCFPIMSLEDALAGGLSTA